MSRGRRRAFLRVHVHQLEAVGRVVDHRKVKRCVVRLREPAVAGRVPLHRGPHTVALAEDGPLAACEDLRRLVHDVEDGRTVLLGDRHVERITRSFEAGVLVQCVVDDQFRHHLEAACGVDEGQEGLEGTVAGWMSVLWAMS